MSWEDVQGYLRCLSDKTRQAYRLPSESEWEYACRAGTITRFNTGHIITMDQANFCGEELGEGCPEGRYLEQTAPVASYAPNAFGLCEMHGTAWEWVADCWDEIYIGARKDSSAWMGGDCGRALLRGGFWRHSGALLRSADREWNFCGSRFRNVGLRVARSVML